MSIRKSTAVSVVCKFCGLEFSLPRWQAKTRIYCSAACGYKAKKAVPLVDRIRRYTGETTPSGCVLWTGCLDAAGYGKIHDGTTGKLLKVSRAVWELAFGEIPVGKHVCHTCDNPLCISIDHLFIGTPLDNMRDKVAKGRQTRGESHITAKITEADVLSIRRVYAEGSVTQAELAEQYGISHQQVHRIVNRLRWKHI